LFSFQVLPIILVPLALGALTVRSEGSLPPFVYALF
jgi:hypothetical protein